MEDGKGKGRELVDEKPEEEESNSNSEFNYEFDYSWMGELEDQYKNEKAVCIKVEERDGEIKKVLVTDPDENMETVRAMAAEHIDNVLKVMLYEGPVPVVKVTVISRDEADAGGKSKNTLAYYQYISREDKPAPGEGIVYIIEDSIIPEKLVSLSATIAHELTHLAQDLICGGPGPKGDHESEGSYVLKAIREGQAEFVADMLTNEVGTSPPAELPGKNLRLDDDSEKVIKNLDTFLQYSFGRKYVEKIYIDNDNDMRAVNELLKVVPNIDINQALMQYIGKDVFEDPNDSEKALFEGYRDDLLGSRGLARLEESQMADIDLQQSELVFAIRKIMLMGYSFQGLLKHLEIGEIRNMKLFKHSQNGKNAAITYITFDSDENGKKFYDQLLKDINRSCFVIGKSTTSGLKKIQMANFEEGSQVTKSRWVYTEDRSEKVVIIFDLELGYNGHPLEINDSILDNLVESIMKRMRTGQ